MIAQDGSTSQSRYYVNFFPGPVRFLIFFRRYTNIILVFQKAENLICVTEDKPEQNLIEGLAQNIKQLESSCQTIGFRKKSDPIWIQSESEIGSRSDQLFFCIRIRSN